MMMVLHTFKMEQYLQLIQLQFQILLYKTVILQIMQHQVVQYLIGIVLETLGGYPKRITVGVYHYKVTYLKTIQFHKN